jgi:hypothetical protein
MKTAGTCFILISILCAIPTIIVAIDDTNQIPATYLLVAIIPIILFFTAGVSLVNGHDEYLKELKQLENKINSSHSN